MGKTVIRLGGYQGPSSVHTRAAVKFGEALERDASDLASFELVSDVLALGRQSGELPAMVEQGELALCYISTVRFAPAVPQLKIFELPFVVRDRSRTQRALQGEFGARLKEWMLESTPFRALGFWDNGFRHITNRVRPIRKPADCKGLRIRTQLSDLHAETMRALGFEPIPVDVKEYVEQIATDRFQAQENPLTNTFNFNVHRYDRYITLSGHLFGTSALVCNQAQFASWPAKLRSAVEQAGREATVFQHTLAAREDDEILAKLDPRENDVIRLTPKEHRAFVSAVGPVIERHRGSIDADLFKYLA
jgi:TRAP-type transport system periplasmic protein